MTDQIAPSYPDLVTLVDHQDQVVGSMDKIEAHRWPAKLHRAISVYLFRRNAAGEVEVLIQQRSDLKIVGAGQWANTCCGNVWPGESYEACAYRRLKAELGIEAVKIEPLYHFFYQVQCNDEFGENESDQVFVGWYDQSVIPNPKEAATATWIKFEDFSLSQPIAPWTQIMLSDPQLRAKITTFISDHQGN